MLKVKRRKLKVTNLRTRGNELLLPSSISDAGGGGRVSLEFNRSTGVHGNGNDLKSDDISHWRPWRTSPGFSVNLEPPGGRYRQ